MKKKRKREKERDCRVVMEGVEYFSETLREEAIIHRLKSGSLNSQLCTVIF